MHFDRFYAARSLYSALFIVSNSTDLETSRFSNVVQQAAFWAARYLNACTYLSMENNDGRELLENVTISDVSGTPYIMQRMDNTQLLATDLLQHHNGIVVDLGAGDFIPVNYSSDDLLSQDLTEEDRNLAAALVAVQLSQQQKQQQIQQESNVIINTTLPSLVSTTLGECSSC